MLDHKDVLRKQTAWEIALVRQFGGKRKRGRLPRQVIPKGIMVEYAKALVNLIRAAKEAYRPVIEALRAARTDAADFSKKAKEEAARITAGAPGDLSRQVKIPARRLRRLLDEAEAMLNSTVSTAAVETLATKFATRTSTHQRIQLGGQVRAALGADPILRDPPLGGVTEDFVEQNVSLIKRIPKRLHEKVEGMVMNSVAKGELNVDLASAIEGQFGIAERHARLIARDQVTKYYGALNRTRQENMGVKRFIWRTVNDERVRDEHADLEGEVFSWDDLPLNKKGEPIYPGSEIQCRCSSEPVLEDLLEELDDVEERGGVVGGAAGAGDVGIGFDLDPGEDDE